MARSGLAAETRHVLLTLSLKMDETGGSCYPPISELVELTGRDKKTVLKHLAIAEEKGWISVSQHGYRGQKWRRNEYVACWPGRDLVGEVSACSDSERGGSAPPRSDGSEVVETAPEGGGTDDPKVVEQLHQDKNIPTNLPENDPAEREGADARGQERQPETPALDDTPGTAAFQKRVMRFCSGRGFIAGPWPDWDANASPEWIARRFAALTSEERLEAERWRDPYLLDIAARKKVPIVVGNFFKGKAWTGLDPAILDRVEKLRQGKLAPDERAKPDGWAACLGPVGMARLFATLLAGPADAAAARGPLLTDPLLRAAWPQVFEWQALLRMKGGVVFGPRWHALKAVMEPVPQGTAGLADWKAAFAERGWPWLAAFDRAEVVYCPKGGPAQGLGAFERALREASDKQEAVSATGANRDHKDGKAA